MPPRAAAGSSRRITLSEGDRLLHPLASPTLAGPSFLRRSGQVLDRERPLRLEVYELFRQHPELLVAEEEGLTKGRWQVACGEAPLVAGTEGRCCRPDASHLPHLSRPTPWTPAP